MKGHYFDLDMLDIGQCNTFSEGYGMTNVKVYLDDGRTLAVNEMMPHTVRLFRINAV